MDWSHYLIPYAYQPIYELSTGKVYGYEALMRPAGMTPDEFILSKLTPDGRVDTHTIELITMYSALWHFAGLDGLLFVNSFPNECLSDEEFMDLYDIFGPELLGRLVVEILEYPSYDPDKWRKKKTQFHAVGCRFAVDDYGTGINNISMVRQLKPDIVKLDRSFLARARQNDLGLYYLNERMRALSDEGALILMEGVETKTDARLAKESMASLGQGFYYSVPMPCDRLASAM